MKKVVLIGLGGVGGYFGYKLLDAKSGNEIQINFVARGDTYKVVKERGLTLLSPETNAAPLYVENIYEEVGSAPAADMYILCVKEYDLEDLCRQLKDLISEKTVLLPLMNGVDIYERIRSVIDKGTVLFSCVYVASHIKALGIIEQKGQQGKIFIGKDPKYTTPFPSWMTHLFESSGINASFMDDASPAIWTKFLFIASFGLVTGCHNVSIGTVLQQNKLKQQAATIMEEILRIAEKKGIHLPNNAIEETFKRAATFPAETKTSLQLDIHQQKPKNELALFAGAIINYAKEMKVEAKATEKVYRELRQLTHG